MSDIITILPADWLSRKKHTRCEAIVTDAVKGWRERAGKDFNCERLSRYEVGGKKLCKLHAGEALINYHLKGK